MRIAVYGATGRMGRLVLAEVLQDPDLVLHAALTRPGSPHLGANAGELAGVGHTGERIQADLTALVGADVIIDFSQPDGLRALLDTATAPIVSGTTGLSAEDEQAVQRFAKRAPILLAANFSTGVAVLRHLVRQAAALLPDWDAEIVESHHKHKVDAPSGTARALVASVEDGRGQQVVHVHGRAGPVGPRTPGTIGVHALRLGDVIGEHSLSLGGSGEILRLAHSATERRVFAVGAVRAARWIHQRPAGRYDFAQVVGLTSDA